MKKILNKLFKRNETPLSSRITNDTVAEHREKILAGGRRFKYPIQYARHKIVINAILISIAALILVVAAIWWQLYPVASTSEFFYRITKVIPLPVANVDGQSVLYSDYLMQYLSSIHFTEQKEQQDLDNESGKGQIDFFKQQSMQNVIADAYAAKLAKKMNLSVSDVELEGFIKSQRQAINGEMTEQAYNSSILEYLGWSPGEYRHSTRNSLLRHKVAYAMDTKAQAAADSVVNGVKSDPNVDFKILATSVAEQSTLKVIYGSSGWVPKINQDGGLAVEAAKLTKSQTSAIVKSTKGDGYYVIRLIDINDDQVNYEYVKIPLSEFANSLKALTDADKVKIYISI